MSIKHLPINSLPHKILRMSNNDTNIRYTYQITNG